MYKLETNFIPENEILDVTRLFRDKLTDDDKIVHRFEFFNNEINNFVSINNEEYVYSDIISVSQSEELLHKRELKRACKTAVYKALKEYTGLVVPWGSLTGIRPTKLAYEYLNCGGSVDNLVDFLVKKYDILPQKAKILKNIVLCQVEYVGLDEHFVNLYVHIPFCITKCSYCSFVTHVVDKCKKMIEPYVALLKKEIESSIDLIYSEGKAIHSIYIGGGTPTALDDQSLEIVLKACSGFNVEFTCEAGRPDTITESKLLLMKKYGVTRVCVNPQTVNDKTLVKIGRKHSSEDFFNSYNLVKSLGFDVNVDLIAGLEDESFEDFKRSFDSVVALKPENFTVHTLCIKNGSELKNSGGSNNSDIVRMVDYAEETAKELGYVPYYLYRQKQMLGNFENVGFCLPGKECVNNITTMEEVLTVVGCGAGAISKRVFNAEHRIERYANLRDVKLYIEEFDDRVKKKVNFFKNTP